MGISDTQKIVISDQVLSQEVSGETVLLDLASEQYFGLDKVGTRIWQLLTEGKAEAEVVEVLLEEYDVSKEQLEADTNELLERLVKAGLVTLDPFAE